MPARITWRKQGLVFAPPGDRPWLRSHASLPVAQQLDKDRARVFFASRDGRNRSHIGSVEVELDDDETVRVAAPPPSEPVLCPGPLGCFDDHGVYPASVVQAGDRVLLYYIGWNPGPRRPLFYASIGLAVSEDGGATFHRRGPAPIMARGDYDPCLVTSPCVLREGDRWRMWYVSGFRWDEGPDGPRSWYHVKYAESDDGVRWRREGRVAIELRDGERNIARPCTIPTKGGYRMWYSFAGEEAYRIGYAESDDGLTWERLDQQAGLHPTPGEFDGLAMAYPWETSLGGRTVLLYNGDGFGREGFGAAIAPQA